MAFAFDPGALLGASFPLIDGARVRLRLARSSDATAIASLLGVGEDDLQVKRLVQFDPRRRYVVCATMLRGAGEQLVGVGSIGFGEVEETLPDTLVVQDGIDDLRELLAAALIGCAGVFSARAA